MRTKRKRKDSEMDGESPDTEYDLPDVGTLIAIYNLVYVIEM